MLTHVSDMEVSKHHSSALLWGLPRAVRLQVSPATMSTAQLARTSLDAATRARTAKGSWMRAVFAAMMDTQSTVESVALTTRAPMAESGAPQLLLDMSCAR